MAEDGQSEAYTKAIYVALNSTIRSMTLQILKYRRDRREWNRWPLEAV